MSSKINTADPDEEDLISKLESRKNFEMEEAALWLLKTTGSREDIRVSVCSDRLLSAFRPLIISAYSSIQVNSVAALVDLSTEKVNRVKIVQSGILPNLVFVLETGSPDVQELADRALIQLGPR